MAIESYSKRTKNLVSRIESSNSTFREQVLNKSVHLLALNKRSVLKHARLQVEALTPSLDPDKVDNGTGSRLAAILYREILNHLNSFKSPSVDLTLLGNSKADGALKANSGQKFSSGTIVYRLRPKKAHNVYASLNKRVFSPANRKAAKFLSQLTAPGATIDPGNDVLDIGHLFSSSVNFKATLRELLKSAERLPRESRDEYRQKVREYALLEVKKVSNQYTNNDWGLEIKAQHHISTKELSSTAVVVVSPQAASVNRNDIKKAETAAVKALLNLGAKTYEDLLLNTSGSPTVMQKIEQMLVNSAVSAITKKKLNKDSRGRFISKAEVLKGITKVDSVKGRASVWKAQGREQLQDVTKNLLGIQNILNDYLPTYMRRNMGKGQSKTVLNYRTGRLAESAEVLTVHPVRNDMITAKVRYMENPYSTFAEGGEQDRPKTRDPKRLVDRSIRQILKEKLQIAMAFKSELG